MAPRCSVPLRALAGGRHVPLRGGSTPQPPLMNELVLERVMEVLDGHGGAGWMLEVGPDWRGRSLLERWTGGGVGVDLEARGDYGSEFVQATSHGLPFRSGAFSVVVSCAVLEHDAEFWRSLAEMRRVLEPGGLMVVMVPSYGQASWWSRLEHLVRVALGPRWVRGPRAATYPLHGQPQDFYRFSQACVRDVLLAGLDSVSTEVLMAPPRCIGWGHKPQELVSDPRPPPGHRP